MADPAGMVCASGEYKGHKIDVCVDQAEYTNTRRHQALSSSASTTQIVGVDQSGKEIKILGKGKDRNALWREFAKTPRGDIAGYIFKSFPDNVFPQSRSGFDGPNNPLVDVPGRAITLDDGRTMLGAQ